MTVDVLKFDSLASSAALEQTVLEQTVKDHLLASAELKQRVAQECSASVVAAARLMAEALRQGGKVLLCGNGGSAADCQHIAGELVNWLNKDFQRPGLPAIALTADSSILTAIANDSSFEQIFERQVQALGRPGDALLGISTSGNSGNVVRAVQAAKALEIGTVVLTGVGGRLGDLADVAIRVPDHNTQRIQEAHLAIEHMLCELVEVYLFSEKQK
ncbi:D-sedoheptulose-7-phosphate isomerase [Nodosilinea nodulosa]|uniref:D-sedoheptulose-7-phosphate isomerase n=1 Tax=Nodosilinea nodulosa TaxID=416001 RepID=UPI00031E92BC|nr:D-sedoheptulose 7-phosphate isomerase [Nodosilinea nodulosa]